MNLDFCRFIRTVSCHQRSECGELIPIYVNEEFNNLFDSKLNYEKGFDFQEKKEKYIEALQTNWSFPVKNVVFIDDLCEEAWCPFIFTCVKLYSDQSYVLRTRFEKLVERDGDIRWKSWGIDDEENLTGMTREEFELLKVNLEKDMSDFNNESGKHFYKGILTWKNCD